MCPIAAGDAEGDLDVALRDGVAVVRVRGELDLRRVRVLAPLVESALGVDGTRPAADLPPAVLDLQHVGFADSSAVRLCARLDDRLRAAGSALQVRARGPAAVALEVAGFGDLLAERAERDALAGDAPERPTGGVGAPGDHGRGTPRHELDFLADAGAPLVARTVVRSWLGAAGHREVDDVVLVVSELVTNVVLHTAGPGRLGLWTDIPLLVEVVDGGVDPPATRARAGSDGGFGLRLVDRLSRRWGWAPRPGGKAVWVELVPPTSRREPDVGTSGP